MGRVSLDTELVLRDLVSGAGLDAGMVKRLAKASGSEGKLSRSCSQLTTALVDNRVYDLTPSSLRGQTPADAPALARALSPIASWVAGDEAALDAPIAPSEGTGLTAGLTQLALALRAAVKEEGDAIPLSSLFTSELSSAETATLVGVADRLVARMTEVLPTGKKKKNKNGQLRKARLFELRDALRGVREHAPVSSEGEVAWKPTMGEEERRKEIGDKVAQGRKALNAAIDAALTEKKAVA